VKHLRLPWLVGLVSVAVLTAPASGQGEQPLPSTGEAAIISVKRGNATEIASLLHDLYNGSGTSREGRVVVFAIPMTNCLFVKATSADVQAIRERLRPL
jgi:hypothetical protein